MQTPTFTQVSRFGKIAAFGVMCVIGSFMLGIETAGEVHPFAATQATSIEVFDADVPAYAAGDMTGDGFVTIEDAIALLEITQGYTIPTSTQLKADPNSDGRLTVEDALRILRTLSVR